ncbi:MAG: 4-hydroxythreonine-4-phosphate dehydrogenase PdxA [Deltaproteobacteria bacterium]|nr:4-hydroxythreonine-4-phosphate dehydrogenase PdxA [Deltaproteobacteria bacterium]
MSHLPIIGITMGDPSGIGPEIIRKALSDSKIYEICRPVVWGDAGALSVKIHGVSGKPIREISSPLEAGGDPGGIDLIAVSQLGKEAITPGIPRVEGGEAMVSYISKAVETAQRGEIAAIVTGPINKALMHEAGYSFDGHTPLIAHLTNTKDYVMMLAGNRLKVTLATIHCALERVPYILNTDRIHRTIWMTWQALRLDFGIKEPRLGVAALNPHGGESGLFGSEEDRMIGPAVERAMSDGCLVEGPFPADTLFYKASKGEFDAVVAMYHDQGLIPLKLLHFSDAVNITLGLPIVRTSADHGTAYDIAGKGVADPSSLKAAICMAVTVAENRARGKGLSS